MIKRGYGKDNEQITIIGFGGIVVTDEDQKDANNYTSYAIDQGINYFDVAPVYGNAQEKLGVALEGKRNDIFLACKTEKRTKKEAKEALFDSLKKLKTDYFDLYQIHGVSDVKDAKTVLGSEGALETLIWAKKEGFIRHIGVSVHCEKSFEMLINEFDFESVLFPYNFVSLFNTEFGKKIYDVCEEKNVTKLALKALALTSWEENETQNYKKCWYKPIEDHKLQDLALRYVLSQNITAAIPPGDFSLFKRAVEIANNYKPITSEEIDYLKEKSDEYSPIF